VAKGKRTRTARTTHLWVPPSRVGVGGADGVAVAGLAVDLLARVGLGGVVNDQEDRAAGEELPDEVAGQGESQSEGGPLRGREESLVAGAVPAGEASEGPTEVGDRAPPGGQDRRDEDELEADQTRVGEVGGEELEERFGSAR
jgi:hypothetical protein